MEDPGFDDDDGLGSQSSADSDVGANLLGSTLSGDALARSLVDTQTSNELGLVRSEVLRLRAKIDQLEREKDDMVENFRGTTKVLINRIKELEAEISEGKSRPQTAAVIDRIENRPSARPPLPNSRGSSRGSAGGSSNASKHAPEVLRIEEEPPSPPVQAAALAAPAGSGGPRAETSSPRPEICPPAAQAPESSVCGNCGREIPGGNLVSHSIHCYRNNYRCAACDQVLALRDKEAHIEEWTAPARFVKAAAARDLATLRLMSEHGLDLGTATHPETQETVLHAAARLCDVEFISFCMGHGVDIDPVNAEGDTPLHLAAEEAEVQSVKLLVELGSNLNAQNGKGETPLCIVCRRGAPAAAKYLLEMRADAEARTRLGDTPLQLAQRLGHQETVLALCTAGAPLRPGTPQRVRSASPVPPGVPSAGGLAGPPGGYPTAPKARRRKDSPSPPVNFGARPPALAR